MRFVTIQYSGVRINMNTAQASFEEVNKLLEAYAPSILAPDS